MKKILFFVFAAMVASFTVNAQQPTVSLKSDPSKEAKKEAKAFQKDGWMVPAGALPLARQLERSWELKYTFDANGYETYIEGQAMSIGATYDAARMQALELAKIDLIGKLESQITQITENTVANSQLSREQAESVTKTVAASKSIVSQKLGRVMTVVELYREKPRKNKEGLLRINYNKEKAMQVAANTIREELAKEGKQLHEELNKALGN